MSFQLPSSLPCAVFVNPKIDFTQRENIAYTYGQQAKSYESDPLAGQLCPGCKILRWNQTTEVQSLMVEFYAEQLNSAQAAGSAGQYPDNFEALLKANAGPNEFWNYSYEQDGLVQGVPGQLNTLYTAEVGTGRPVLVVIP